MPKEYVVGDTSYHFPDEYTDEQVQGILTRQGIIKPPPAPEQPSAMSRFFSSLGGAVNPIPAIEEYFNRPTQTRAMTEGLTAGMQSRGRQRTPEELATIERGYAAKVGPGPGPSPVPMGAEPAALAGTQFREGDIAGGIGTLGGAYGVAPAAGYGLMKGGQLVGTRAGRAQLARATSQTLEKAETKLLGPRVPERMMQQALKPTAANIRFVADMERALPELKVTEAQLGRPIANLDDLLEATKIAKKRVWEQREALAPGQSLRQINLEPVADAIEATISARTKLMDPTGAEGIRKIADQYRGRTFTIQEAESYLQDVNAQLDAYYAKNPAAQRVSRAANPDTAALDVEAKLLRHRIYGELDAPGQGEGPREMSRRYGALSNTEREIYRRLNVAQRQAPLSLSEQIGTPRAFEQAAQGVGRVFTGEIIGGTVDVLKGLGMRKLTKELKEMNTANRLIERTFRNYTGTPATVTVQQVKPRGLLTGGSIVTPPPPDPSFVRGTTGIYPTGPNPRRALPPPQIVTPPPADVSGIQVVDAARGIARDPRTGRLFRYYTSGQR